MTIQVYEVRANGPATLVQERREVAPDTLRVALVMPEADQ